MRIRRLFVVLFMAAVCKAQVLAPTGTLRATFLENNPVQGRVDAKTGAVSGPAVDLTRELGRQLGVPVSVVGVAGARALIDSVKNHTADIGFLAFDPSRAADVDFSQVYSLSWRSYSVPANSTLHAVADADRKGIRIGAAIGDSPELYLSRNLKNAELKRYANPPAADVLKMLAAGEIDAWAANRQRLIEMAASAPNLCYPITISRSSRRSLSPKAITPRSMRSIVFSMTRGLRVSSGKPSIKPG
jgi:polar amino acid transport system substrate-binding protein